MCSSIGGGVFLVEGRQAGACAGRSVSLPLPNSLHVFSFSSLYYISPPISFYLLSSLVLCISAKLSYCLSLPAPVGFNNDRSRNYFRNNLNTSSTTGKCVF